MIVVIAGVDGGVLVIPLTGIVYGVRQWTDGNRVGHGRAECAVGFLALSVAGWG
jgi:hypothetical protein